MGTGMMHGSGSYDASSKIIKDKGTFTCPVREKPVDYRSEWKILDKNNTRFSMWAPDFETGKEYKQMEIVYKRVQ